MPTAHAGELTPEEQHKRARAHLDAAQDDMDKAGQHVVCVNSSRAGLQLVHRCIRETTALRSRP